MDVQVVTLVNAIVRERGKGSTHHDEGKLKVIIQMLKIEIYIHLLLKLDVLFYIDRWYSV